MQIFFGGIFDVLTLGAGTTRDTIVASQSGQAPEPRLAAISDLTITGDGLGRHRGKWLEQKKLRGGDTH